MRDNGWFLDKDGALAYEKYVVSRLHSRWAETTVAVAELSGTERVLDAACGTGMVARVAASRLGPDGSVAGVDGSPHMIAVAREIEPAIDWRVADVTSLPWPDGTFDVVTCQQGLQFVSEPLAALREMRRVLAPNGRIVINLSCALERNPYFLQLSDVLRDHGVDGAATLIERICSLHGRAALEGLLGEARFEDISIECERRPLHLPVPSTFVPQQLCAIPSKASELTPDIEARVIEDLNRRLKPYLGAAGLSVPFESHYARARCAT